MGVKNETKSLSQQKGSLGYLDKLQYEKANVNDKEQNISDTESINSESSEEENAILELDQVFTHFFLFP